ncbi:MAG: AmmeMemoRadiSam system protein A [Armatimonadetes bacterium]|nr:AmmeMemoRadiSam system protein A [Armatimonadota bacterium]MDW8122976.1 AmmeMemoRadiSam system protein A [Armatimonadota bacterium]
MLNLTQGRFLVSLARRAIAWALERGEPLQPPKDVDPELLRPAGVFVTLHSHELGEPVLRGCIGLPTPIKPLVEATIDAAFSAAFRDPRFEPVSKEELPTITVEVSVLTDRKKVISAHPSQIPHQIVIGRDGLYVEGTFERGLLLPQVAPAHGFSAEEFLDQVCLKAGLPRDAWRKGQATIYTFQAQIFAEKEPGGEVVELTWRPGEPGGGKTGK